MNESHDAPLLPGSARARPDRTLPPAHGAGPLNKGRRSIADVLERAGQKDGADYMRALDLDRIDHRVQQTMRDVESGVRSKPLLSVAAAVFAGFVIGRILRD